MINDQIAERTLRKGEEFESLVKPVLIQEYKFLGSEKIQKMLIKDLLVDFNRHLKDG